MNGKESAGMGKLSARNAAVDLYKLYYCFIIAAFHFYLYTHEHLIGGGNAVEFFILVSGVFFFAGWDRRKEGMGADERSRYPLQFLKKRFFRFFPYTTIAFVSAFVVKYVLVPGLNKETVVLDKLADKLVKGVWELLLIVMNGLNANVNAINGPVWTLSAIFLVEVCFICLMCQNEKGFFTVVLPFVLLFGLGFMASFDDSDHLKWRIFTTQGVFRTAVTTALSYYVYLLSGKLKKLDFTRSGRIVLGVLEILCHVLVLVIMLERNTRYYRWFSTLAMAVSLVITFSGKSVVAELFRGLKHTSVIGDLATCVYLFHRPVINLCYALVGGDPYAMYKQKIPCFLLIAAVSACGLLLVKGAIQGTRKLGAALKKKLLVSE